MNDTNKAIITGKIIHIYEISRNPARVIVTVSANGDNPKIFAAGMQAEYIIQNLRIGDTVTVNANLQSSVKSKIGRTVTVFCDSIRKHYSRTENVNRFYLAGDVVSTRTDTERNVSTMIIRTHVNGRSSTIPVVFYDADHRLFAIVADNPTIAISGKIQTVCKDYGNGKRVYHQNYVADFPRND